MLPQPPIAIENILNNYDIHKYEISYSIRNRENLVNFQEVSATAWKCLVKDQNNTFILKRFPWYCNNTNFAKSVTALQRTLSEQGLPIPQIVKAVNKQLIIEDGEGIYFMQDFVKGNFYTASTQSAYSMGKILAHLHNSSRSINPSDYQGIPHKSITEIALEIIKVYRNKEFADPTVADKLIEIIVVNNKLLGQKYLEHAIFIHGDFNTTNVLFSEDKQVNAILDFDNCCIDHPINDIVRCILHLGFFNFKNILNNGKDFLSIDVDYKIISSFLSGYNDSIEQYHVDIALLAPCMRIMACELFTLGILKGEITHENFDELMDMIAIFDENGVLNRELRANFNSSELSIREPEANHEIS